MDLPLLVNLPSHRSEVLALRMVLLTGRDGIDKEIARMALPQTGTAQMLEEPTQEPEDHSQWPPSSSQTDKAHSRNPA